MTTPRPLSEIARELLDAANYEEATTNLAIRNASLLLVAADALDRAEERVKAADRLVDVADDVVKYNGTSDVIEALDAAIAVYRDSKK